MFKQETTVSYHVKRRNKTSISAVLCEAEAMKHVRFPDLRLRQHCQFLVLAIYVINNIFVQELIKTKVHCLQRRVTGVAKSLVLKWPVQQTMMSPTNRSVKADSHIPSRSPAMPFRQAFRLCLSHLIYSVRPCLIHTYHAVPLPFHEYAVLKATSQGHSRFAAGSRQGRCREIAWERYDMCELTSAVQRRHLDDLSAFGTVGEWQGSGRVAAGERHGKGMVCVNRP
jgi:hypothetical protein